MAANFPDATADAALAIVAGATKVDVCTADPGVTWGSISGTSVGNYTLTAGTGNGDWLIQAGDASGRKVTLLAQSGNNGTATGAASFLVFHNGVDTIYFTSDGDGDTVNSGSPFTIAEYDVWEITDPV